MIDLRALLPNLVPVSHGERLRAALGAFVGILSTALATALIVGPGPDLPLLMAPAGASAVLLFAVPASPLAQPWSILGGNSIAALVGVTSAMLIGDAALASAVAVSASIALMLTLRCLHPPSGAVALTAVIGGPAIASLGYGFVLWPVAINSLLLLATAIAFNRLTGKQYPHSPPVAQPGGNVLPFSPNAGLGITVDDLRRAIAVRDEVVSVDPEDLDDVLQQAALLAFARRSGGVTAGAAMTRSVVTVSPRTTLRVALRQLRAHKLKAMPVIDRAGRVVGMLTQTDLIEKAEWGPVHASSGLGWRLRAMSNSDRPLRGRVEDVMTPVVSMVPAGMPILMVLRVMLETGHHHLPVVHDDGTLAGMVTQADLNAALLGTDIAALPATA